MPEMIEVELYRRSADLVVGRTIARVDAPDAWYLKGGTTARALRSALRGAVVVGTRRIGKLLLLDTDRTTLGLRFGMTGRVLVDGRAPIERLEYSSDRLDPAWVRFSLGFEGGGRLDVVDPRRLGGVQLLPDESRLGFDALAVTPAQLRAALAVSRAPVKAWLLDQHRIAGIGNLLADEMLWRAGIDPARSAASLSAAEVRRLHRHLRATIEELTERGGSHTGDLQVARVRGATCPRDGAPLARRTIGGRTTYSCPRHQR
jgi:formamidopyrimidine-DNA glycosylase